MKHHDMPIVINIFEHSINKDTIIGKKKTCLFNFIQSEIIESNGTSEILLIIIIEKNMWNKLSWMKIILLCGVSFQIFMYNARADGNLTETATATFLIKANIYTDVNGTYYQWNSDLDNISSNEYMTLASTLCNLTIDSLSLGDPFLSNSAQCVKVVFKPVDINFLNQNEQSITTQSSIDNVNSTGVQVNINIELFSVNASLINESTLYNILVSGYNQLNKTLNIFVQNIEIYSISTDRTSEPSTPQTTTSIPSDLSTRPPETTTSTTPSQPHTDSSIVTSESNQHLNYSNLLHCMHVFVL
ncbi:unnamed protein product [Schistosoma turkestanicum]|nr:unnamed protein product [Schistosoma turkestanicum]